MWQDEVTLPQHVVTSGVVNLIPVDNCVLTAQKGIEVQEDNALTIWSQTKGAAEGKLATKGELHAETGHMLSFSAIGGFYELTKSSDGTQKEKIREGGTLIINDGVYQNPTVNLPHIQGILSRATSITQVTMIPS